MPMRSLENDDVDSLESSHELDSRYVLKGDMRFAFETRFHLRNI